MSKEIVVFKKNSNSDAITTDPDLTFKLKIWKPSVFRFIPPNKDYKYLLYWFFHSLRFFKNTYYSAYFLYHNDDLVSSCLVIPSYFKWPFMKAKDVQFTYVMTSEKYRGQGVAVKLILKVMFDLSHKVDSFWYITDTGNPASLRVAEKMGFHCVGEAERTKFLKILRLKITVDN